jgi:hypothetical protein
MAEAEKSAAMPHLIPPHLVPPAEEEGVFLLESETALKELCSGALVCLHPGDGTMAEAEKSAAMPHLIPPHLVPPAEEDGVFLLESETALKEFCSGRSCLFILEVEAWRRRRRMRCLRTLFLRRRARCSWRRG